MRWTDWLLSFGPVEQASRLFRNVPRPARRRSHYPARRFRPRLEVLEDRQLLTGFLVVLGTDNGGPTGQKVSATTGDLRYCIEQADAAHTATTDSIGFSSALTATPHTITLNSANGPLVLSDSHPLNINGPAAPTLNVSGGNKIEVFDIASGTVTIKNLAIIYGNAGSGDGGGISNFGTLTLSNCLLDHDSSTSGYGGGVYNTGTVTLSKTTLYLDSAVLGGGLYSQGFPTAVVTLTNCTISNDSASINGGGLDNETGDLTATNCTIVNDTASASGIGGGVFNGDMATLTNCTLRNDSAVVGGGIYNGASVTLIGCTLSNDSSSNTGAFPGGGGLFTGNNATATLSNCTLANDSATNYGGGIYIYSAGTATLTNCTISNNSAAFSGGGIDNAGGTLNLTNTIVAGNTAGTSGPDIFGAVTTADHDLVGDATGSAGITNGVNGNIVGGNGNPVIDARLGPLQNNGGPTETMALLADSPAIGHADNSMAPTTDQRGHVRIDEVGETTDIGAFEL